MDQSTSKIICSKIGGVTKYNVEGREISLHKVSLLQDHKALTDILNGIEKGKRKVAVNQKDRRGFIPLHYAAYGGSLDCIRILLKNGSKRKTLTNKQRTFLHYVARGGHLSILDYLYTHYDIACLLTIADIHGILPIHLAAKNGNLELIKFLEADNPQQIKMSSSSGMNIVHYCVEQGHFELTKYLLDKYWIDSKFPPDGEGNCLLHFAAFSGNLELYKYILDYHTTRNIITPRNRRGHLPVFPAAASGNLELLKFIIDKNPELLDEKSNSGHNLVIAGIISGELETVKYLVENVNPDFSISDALGLNIFHHAVSGRSLEIFKYLENIVPNGKELIGMVTRKHRNILHLAIASFPVILQDKLIRYLLEESSFSDILKPLLFSKDNDEYTIFHTACKYGNLKGLQYLISTYPDELKIIEEREPKSLPHIAAKSRNFDILRYLISLEDFDFSCKDSLVLYLAECQSSELIREVIQQTGLDINAENADGYTAIHVAAQAGNFIGYRSLLKLDADIRHTSKEGITLLHSATVGGNLDIVKELVNQYNFDVNQPIEFGDQSTPLHYAAMNSDLETVQFLVEKDADVNAVNIHQVSVLHDACKSTNQVDKETQKDVVEHLLKAGAWKSLRVETTGGSREKRTPYDFATDSAICKLLAAHDPSFTAENNLMPFDMLKPFLIEDNILGRGNFGAVYKGSLHGTSVAIKLLESKKCDAEQRFRVEVGIMALIRHPNICMLMGACVENQKYCLVMEYIPITLESLLPTLSFEDILSYSLDICKGMAWLHTRNPSILHCDLKVDNILIDRGRAKVTDFGLATLLDPDTRTVLMEKKYQEFHLSSSAPEVSTDSDFSVRSDIYSFGVCLFTMYFRGKLQYSLESIQLLPSLPEEDEKDSSFVKIITKCCAHFATSRFQSFEEIIIKLSNILNNTEKFEHEKIFQDNHILSMNTETPQPKENQKLTASLGYVDLDL